MVSTTRQALKAATDLPYLTRVASPFDFDAQNSVSRTFSRRLDEAVQEKASALAESSREASRAATAARERISRLEAEHSLALRENGKASVRQRALERELARIKSRYAIPHKQHLFR